METRHHGPGITTSSLQDGDDGRIAQTPGMRIRDWRNTTESTGCDVSCGGTVSLKHNFDVYVLMLGLTSHSFSPDPARAHQEPGTRLCVMG